LVASIEEPRVRAASAAFHHYLTAEAVFLGDAAPVRATWMTAK
jgi:hypothetical protein